MSNLVRENTLHPKISLYHHNLIKLLILDQLKERNQPWDTFVFEVLNPHLNIHKRSHHFHHELRETSLVEEENPNIVHLGEDVSDLTPLCKIPLLVLCPPNLYLFHDLIPEDKRLKVFSVCSGPVPRLQFSLMCRMVIQMMRPRFRKPTQIHPC